MARKPPALARELLRNFPKRRARNTRRRRKGAKGANGASNGAAADAQLASAKVQREQDPAPVQAAADAELRRDVRDALDQHPA